MADGVGYTPGFGLKVAARDVEYSGEQMQVQAVGLVTFSGLDDAKVVADVGADNPLPVSAPSLGAPADAEAAGDGSIIGLLKRLRTLMDGVLTDTELRASAVAVSGPLTDAQLRAAEVPVYDEGVALLLVRVLNLLGAPVNYDPALNRERVTAILESGTLTTVGALTDMTNFGAARSPTELQNNQAIAAWAACHAGRVF